jgi:uncharacterized protein (TIGR00369 family)
VSLEAALKTAAETKDCTALLAAIPYFQFLGVEVASPGIFRMRFGEHLIGNPTIPALHGGTLGALLESVALLESITNTPMSALPKTITLTIDYLRSAKAKDTWARAKVVKAGRRVTTLHAFAWQENEDTPVAMATVHLRVTPAEAAK